MGLIHFCGPRGLRTVHDSHYSLRIWGTKEGMKRQKGNLAVFLQHSRAWSTRMWDLEMPVPGKSLLWGGREDQLLTCCLSLPTPFNDAVSCGLFLVKSKAETHWTQWFKKRETFFLNSWHPLKFISSTGFTHPILTVLFILLIRVIQQGLKTKGLGKEPSSTTYQLCDLGQVA